MALLGAFCALPSPTSAQEERYTSQQAGMVRLCQALGIRDTTTLQAMRTVPRHEFVPADRKRWSYGDHPLPIGYGQTILATSARDRLEGLGYGNERVRYADGFHGWEEAGPFDAVIVTAAAGFMMGAPVPMGLRRLAMALGGIAWAWAANGVASVTGASLAILLSMAVGTRMLILAGGACYLFAAVVMGWRPSSVRTPMTSNAKTQPMGKS